MPEAKAGPKRPLGLVAKMYDNDQLSYILVLVGPLPLQSGIPLKATQPDHITPWPSGNGANSTIIFTPGTGWWRNNDASREKI